MMTLTPVSEATVLSAWAVAELRGPAGARAVEMGLLSAHVLAGLRADAGASFTAADWAQAHQAIRFKRAPLIGNLFELGLEWSATVFDVAQLQALQVIAIPEWHAKYPSHRMDELAGTRYLPGVTPE